MAEIQYHLEDDVRDFYLTYTRMGILIVSIPVILIYLTYSACSISILFKYADKEVSENGTNLSGGEKQRVSLARAVLKDAPILLLDEPDNHLDTEIQESLREILKGEQRIVFFISHRKLGAEWTADKVVNLDSGE